MGEVKILRVEHMVGNRYWIYFSEKVNGYANQPTQSLIVFGEDELDAYKRGIEWIAK